MQAFSPSPLLHTLNPEQPAYGRQARRRAERGETAIGAGRGGCGHQGWVKGLTLKQSHAMVHIVTKRTTKRQRDAILKRAVKRSRRKAGADFSDLLGKA